MTFPTSLLLRNFEAVSNMCMQPNRKAEKCPACATFPCKNPLESVNIDVLGELIHVKRGKRYLLVITNCFTKLVQVVLMNTVSVL